MESLHYRIGNHQDLAQLKKLGLKAWTQFKEELETQHWNQLYNSLNDLNTYVELLSNSTCLVCEDTAQKELVGMAFLVPKGNPSDIYEADWCHLRFVSVNPKYRGLGIGKKLTHMSIALAKENNEEVMALHTSEIMHKARSIYENIGFTILKEIEPRLGIRYWVYTLSLHDNAPQP